MVMNQPTAGGRGHDEHDHRSGCGRPRTDAQQLAEGKLAVVKHADHNGVNGREGAAFGGRENAEADAAQQEHGMRKAGVESIRIFHFPHG